MKNVKICLSVISLAFGLNAFAEIPAEIQNLMNKNGTFISKINGKVYTAEDGSSCEIVENPFRKGKSFVIESAAYFQPVVHLDNAQRKVKNGKVIYTLTSSGRRPGGSVCGDMVPLLSYKKTVEIEGNTLSVRQKYICLGEGPTEILQGCRID